MGYFQLNTPAKQIFRGNLLLIVCCAFYLAWWLLAFRPSGAVTGIKTGWLLLPATAAGLIGVFWATGGIRASVLTETLFPGGRLLAGGLIAYAALLAITALGFHRPVTTELFLIVGWAVLALSELNALYGSGVFSHRLTIGFVIAVAAATAANLVCYVLYYRLDAPAAYLDGTVPLVTAIVVTAAISSAMVFSSGLL